MFSGLISHTGFVAELIKLPNGGATLHVSVPSVDKLELTTGDSIAVDGVCLTLSTVLGYTLSFDVVPETLARTTIGSYKTRQQVNIELSLRLGDRLGGHLVYGHVDTKARILDITPEGQGARYTLTRPDALQRYLVEKGYVAIDGVSLTIAAVAADRFMLALIPETLTRTTVGNRKVHDEVNLEIDPIARYACDLAARYVEPR